MTIALPPPEDRSFADVWTALGGELKPSLDVVVTAPLETGRTFKTGPPVQVPAIIHVEGIDGRVPRETVRRRVTARVQEATKEAAQTSDEGAESSTRAPRRRGRKQ